MLHTKRGERGGNVAPIKITCVLGLTKALTKRQPSDWSRKCWKGRARAFCVLLPLQNTNEQISTIEIGCHKQRVMYACIYWSDLREYVFTNEQKAIDRHEKDSHNYVCIYVFSEMIPTATAPIETISIIWRSNCCVDRITNIGNPTVASMMPTVTTITHWWNKTKKKHKQRKEENRTFPVSSAPETTTTTKVLTQLTRHGCQQGNSRKARKAISTCTGTGTCTVRHISRSEQIHFQTRTHVRPSYGDKLQSCQHTP